MCNKITLLSLLVFNYFGHPHGWGWPVVLVSNSNMHIDIKPYFCLAYRSILKYRGIRCFPGRDLPNSFARFSISRNVNKYGISGLAVSER